MRAPTNCPRCKSYLIHFNDGDHWSCPISTCKRWTYFGTEWVRQVTIKIDDISIYVCLDQERTLIQQGTHYPLHIQTEYNEAFTYLLSKTEEELHSWLKTFLIFQ